MYYVTDVARLGNVIKEALDAYFIEKGKVHVSSNGTKVVLDIQSGFPAENHPTPEGSDAGGGRIDGLDGNIYEISVKKRGSYC